MSPETGLLRQTYKHFEIEVVYARQGRTYTSKRPNSLAARHGRLRHLKVLVGGNFLRKSDGSDYYFLGNLGSQTTFGSIDTAVSAAKSAVDNYIRARADLYRTDRQKAIDWDASELSFLQMTIESATTTLGDYELRLETRRKAVGEIVVGSRDSYGLIASVKARADEAERQTTDQRLFVEAMTRHLVSLRRFLAVTPRNLAEAAERGK
jgi:hypothetical protein